ncbi:hypothetical protein GALL_289390 [mine drainage metagenome]|uniref:Uncharacterized protein n=1 Tax=mine drainage metagenome TaxID=410659 RepID=A0A1J5QZK4_9ZZZZ
MSESCVILPFRPRAQAPRPAPRHTSDLSAEESVEGLWLSLRYLEQEAVLAGHQDLALLIGMAAMAAKDEMGPAHSHRN